MGVKSTVDLTREMAEAKYKELYGQVNDIPIPESNRELADILRDWNDIANNGEGFENYRITDGN